MLFLAFFLHSCKKHVPETSESKQANTRESKEELAAEDYTKELDLAEAIELDFAHWTKIEEILSQEGKRLNSLEQLIQYIDSNAWKLARARTVLLQNSEKLGGEDKDRIEAAQRRVYEILDEARSDESTAAAANACVYRLYAVLLSPMAAFLSAVDFLRQLALDPHRSCAEKELLFVEKLKSSGELMALGYESFKNQDDNSELKSWFDALSSTALSEMGESLSDCNFSEESTQHLKHIFASNDDPEQSDEERAKIAAELLQESDAYIAHTATFEKQLADIERALQLESAAQRNWDAEYCAQSAEGLLAAFEDNASNIAALGDSITDDGVLTIFFDGVESIARTNAILHIYDSSCESQFQDRFVQAALEILVRYAKRRMKLISLVLDEGCSAIDNAIHAMSIKRWKTLQDCIQTIQELESMQNSQLKSESRTQLATLIGEVKTVHAECKDSKFHAVLAKF